MEKVALKVVSKDGTQIAYDTRGSGPAVILVDGALCYRGFGPMPGLGDLLQTNFTVYNYDRRGRGQSTDTLPYKLKREVEDIEALIDATGGKAYLFGISSGGCLGIEAAAKLGSKVEKLAVYEPPYVTKKKAVKAWKEYRKELQKAIDEHRNGDAVSLFMNLVGTPADQIVEMRQSPMWAMFEAVAPTLTDDAEAMGEDRTVPTKRAAKVKTPTLVMNGTITPLVPEADAELADAMPHAQRRVLEGQPHDVDLNVLAAALTPFFME